jgi:hypothetical protein
MANLKTMLSQLQTQLLAQNWTGSSNNVFPTNSVIVSRYVPENQLRVLRVPICILMPGNFTCDPVWNAAVDFWRVEITARIIVTIPGEAVGQSGLMGANRQPLKSEGAGILDVIQEVFNAIGKLNVKDSANFQVQFYMKGGGGGIHISDSVHWEYCDFLFWAFVTAP